MKWVKYFVAVQIVVDDHCDEVQYNRTTHLQIKGSCD